MRREPCSRNPSLVNGPSAIDRPGDDDRDGHCHAGYRDPHSDVVVLHQFIPDLQLEDIVGYHGEDYEENEP